MSASSVSAFLHHAAAFLLFACLFYEIVTFRGVISVEDARRLRRVDILYGISATVVLVIGVLRVLYFDKGTDFYMQNWIFHAKIGFFALLVVLSFYPTKQFLSWRAPLSENRPPIVPSYVGARVRLALHLEATLVVLILLAAAMLSRGAGSFA